MKRLRIEEVKVLESSDLATLIRTIPGKLVSLRLVGFELIGDFKLVVQAISTCKYLSDIEINCIKMFKFRMASLGEVLAPLPLKNIHLYLSHMSKNAPCNLLAPILSKPNQSLTSLEIGSWNPPDPKVAESFLASVAASATLQHLKFRGGLPLEAIIKMVRANKALKSLAVRTRRKPDLTKLANALKDNQTLEDLEIDLPWSASTNDAEVEAFHTALCASEPFTHLKKLIVHPWYHPFQSEVEEYSTAVKNHIKGIDFELALNKAGRARLLTGDESAPAAEWMKAIGSQSDLSVIYYFLRKNPSLCNLVPANDESPKPNKRSPWLWYLLNRENVGCLYMEGVGENGTENQAQGIQ